MSSRFFSRGDSDSESSSSDEEELYVEHEEAEEESSEEEVEEEEDSDDESSDDDEAPKGKNWFLKGDDESGESEDEDRVTVVKSAKDKRLEELEGTVKLIDNAEKISDWAVISSG